MCRQSVGVDVSVCVGVCPKKALLYFAYKPGRSVSTKYKTNVPRTFPTQSFPRRCQSVGAPSPLALQRERSPADQNQVAQLSRLKHTQQCVTPGGTHQKSAPLSKACPPLSAAHFFSLLSVALTLDFLTPRTTDVRIISKRTPSKTGTESETILPNL